MRSNYLLGSPKIRGNPEIGITHYLFFSNNEKSLLSNYQCKIFKGESEILRYKFFDRNILSARLLSTLEFRFVKMICKRIITKLSKFPTHMTYVHTTQGQGGESSWVDKLIMVNSEYRVSLDSFRENNYLIAQNGDALNFHVLIITWKIKGESIRGEKPFEKILYASCK